MKKLTAIILVLAITLVTPLQYGVQQAEATTTYITVSSFAKSLAAELGLQPAVEGDGYVTRLINIGIIKEGDFKNYSTNLTRGDMLVLLNRADKFLNGSAVEEELVKTVIEKRISDISKAAKSKREDIAEGYAKGFLKGYSNGDYAPDRNLKLTTKVTKTGALNCIKMLKDKSLRAKISPDGQLIRTTKLPNNAYMYPYILDSFPNYYYEAKLRFEGVTQRINGKIVPMVSPEDFTYPKDVAKARYGVIDDFNAAKKNYYEIWENKVRTTVWNTFNVDYRTIDDNWVETMAQADAQIDYSTDTVYHFLNRYVTEMKKNKTIVECDKAAIDSSSLYFYNGSFYIRCYIHYRIVSTNTKTFYTADELSGKLWGPYNCVLYSRTSYTDIENYILGKWVNGVFDVSISSPVTGNDGSFFGVSYTNWSPELYRFIERK